MSNKFNARGCYVCVDCQRWIVKEGKGRPKCEPNHKVVYFDSKKEYRRYNDLRLLEKAGKISDLTVKPRFPLEVNGKLIATQIPDFSYYEKDKLVVEDVKGYLDNSQKRVFDILCKLTEAIHGVRVEIV